MAKPISQEDEESIEQGRAAVVTLGVITPLMGEARDRVVQKLINAYRSGELTHDMLVGSVGEMAALDNLKKQLENDQRLAIGAMERVHG